MRRVFSPRTQKYGRRRREQLMVSAVTILRMGEGELDESDLVVGARSKSKVYEGKARISTLKGAGVTMIGDVPLDSRSTSVEIPWNAPVPRQDDVVVINDDPSDNDLDLRAVQVRDIDAGGLLHLSRVLVCTGFAESRLWED